MFETVALGVGGAEYYQLAFVELDEAALNSDTTLKVFDVFGQIRPLIDSNASGRDWNLATNMVIQGEAGMQLMGDWAKGEFSVAGQQPGLITFAHRHPEPMVRLALTSTALRFLSRAIRPLKMRKRLWPGNPVA